MVTSCSASPSPFSYIRITPTCTNPWVAIGNFVPASPSTPLGITSCVGITGTIISPDPNTGCPRPDPTQQCNPFGVPTTGYVNQCTVINWNGVAASYPLVDSTVLASVNLVCSPKANVGLKPEILSARYGCCPLDVTVPLDQSCFALSNVTECATVTRNCIPLPDNSGSVVLPQADGIMQFITQICGSATNVAQSSSLASPYGVYSFIIKPPRFPATFDTSGFGSNFPSCYNGNPFTQFFQQQAIPLEGYGNYNWINFTIGSCFNGLVPTGPCSQLVTLLYIGSICTDVLCTQQPVGGQLIPRKNLCSILLPDLLAYYYPYYYANVKFSITDSNGYPRRCKSKFGVNCYLKVEPYSPADAAQFCVYFGQTRNCGGVNQILVNTLVDLTCLLYGGNVYVITSAKTRYSLF